MSSILTRALIESPKFHDPGVLTAEGELKCEPAILKPGWGQAPIERDRQCSAPPGLRLFAFACSLASPARKSFAPCPELYNLEADPNESYDAAIDHPDVVREIEQDIEALILTFPENVIQAYAELKANPGSPFTPPGAATRPDNLIARHSQWIPPSRRGNS